MGVDVSVGVKVGAAAEGTISGVDVWVGEAMVSVGRGVKVSAGVMLAGRINPLELDAPAPLLSDTGTEVNVAEAGGSINVMAESIWIRPAPEYRSQPTGPTSSAVDSIAFLTTPALLVKENRIAASPLTKGADIEVPLCVK